MSVRLYNGQQLEKGNQDSSGCIVGGAQWEKKTKDLQMLIPNNQDTSWQGDQLGSLTAVRELAKTSSLDKRHMAAAPNMETNKNDERMRLTIIGFG